MCSKFEEITSYNDFIFSEIMKSYGLWFDYLQVAFEYISYDYMFEIKSPGTYSYEI